MGGKGVGGHVDSCGPVYVASTVSCWLTLKAKCTNLGGVDLAADGPTGYAFLDHCSDASYARLRPHHAQRHARDQNLMWPW